MSMYEGVLEREDAEQVELEESTARRTLESGPR
jgi:hypothetical protein